MCAINVRKEQMVTLSKRDYEMMRETLEILSDTKTAKRVLESIEQAKKGRTISEKVFVRKFGL